MQRFKTYQINTASGPVPACRRGDHYTLYLLCDQRHAHGSSRETGSTYLLLGAPSSEATSVWLPAHQTGYGCLFSEAFVQACCPEGGWEPDQLLRTRQKQVLALPGPQAAYFASLFERMLTEQQSTYFFKHELMRTYLRLILLELLRLPLPSPKRVFSYYYRRPGPTGTLGLSWFHRLRC